MQILSALTPASLLAFLAFVALAPSHPAVSAQAGARERTLFVSAIGAGGVPVEGLSPDDFVIREDGVRREVLRVSRAIEPIDIALLVDDSASSADLVPRMREGLRAFVATMTPANNLALVGLGARPTIFVDYTTDRKRLTDGIGRVFTQTTSGMTLLDGIVEVSNGLAKRDTPRAVLVPVITDGIEYSNRDSRYVIDAMTKAGVALHAVTVGTFSLSDDEAIRNRGNVLDQGTRATGGQQISLLAATAVEQALARLARELSSQYKVVYSRPESLIPPEKIEVSPRGSGMTMRGTPARGQKTGA